MNCPVRQLIELIELYPSSLRRPIILDEKRMTEALMRMKFGHLYCETIPKQELKNATLRAEIG